MRYQHQAGYTASGTANYHPKISVGWQNHSGLWTLLGPPWYKHLPWKVIITLCAEESFGHARLPQNMHSYSPLIELFVDFINFASSVLPNCHVQIKIIFCFIHCRQTSKTNICTKWRPRDHWLPIYSIEYFGVYSVPRFSLPVIAKWRITQRFVECKRFHNSGLVRALWRKETALFLIVNILAQARWALFKFLSGWSVFLVLSYSNLEIV